MMKEVPGLIARKFGIQITEQTVTNDFKKKSGNPTGYISHVVPLARLFGLLMRRSVILIIVTLKSTKT